MTVFHYDQATIDPVQEDISNCASHGSRSLARADDLDSFDLAKIVFPIFDQKAVAADREIVTNRLHRIHRSKSAGNEIVDDFTVLGHLAKNESSFYKPVMPPKRYPPP